ncbi:MAG: hypothetical protein ABSC06_27855 [Rhodopila sp.]|jgi:hypothetical protein
MAQHEIVDGGRGQSPGSESALSQASLNHHDSSLERRQMCFLADGFIQLEDNPARMSSRTPGKQVGTQMNMDKKG